MTMRFANRTGQAGTYKTGSPNYVEVLNTEPARTGMVTFAAKVADDSWVDGDQTGILVAKDAANYKVWLATWVAATERFNVSIEEESVGTISDSDDVEVTAVLTTAMMGSVIFDPQTVVISGVTHTTIDADTGKLHRCTSASDITITLGDGCKVGWHGVFVQEGAGIPSFARSSTDTINGATGNIPIYARYKSAYVYQASEGAWVAVT